MAGARRCASGICQRMGTDQSGWGKEGLGFYPFRFVSISARYGTAEKLPTNLTNRNEWGGKVGGRVAGARRCASGICQRMGTDQSGWGKEGLGFYPFRFASISARNGTAEKLPTNLTNQNEWGGKVGGRVAGARRCASGICQRMGADQSGWGKEGLGLCPFRFVSISARYGTAEKLPTNLTNQNEWGGEVCERAAWGEAETNGICRRMGTDQNGWSRKRGTGRPRWHEAMAEGCGQKRAGNFRQRVTRQDGSFPIRFDPFRSVGETPLLFCHSL